MKSARRPPGAVSLVTKSSFCSFLGWSGWPCPPPPPPYSSGGGWCLLVGGSPPNPPLRRGEPFSLNPCSFPIDSPQRPSPRGHPPGPPLRRGEALANSGQPASRHCVSRHEPPTQQTDGAHQWREQGVTVPCVPPPRGRWNKARWRCLRT